MKPTVDDDDLLTGDEAVQHLIDSWQDLGGGKVEAEAIGNWFVIRRSGGDDTTFLSLVDGTAVTVLNSEATTRHVPKDLRPKDDLGSDGLDLLRDAFENASGGMFPLAEDDAFAVSYREDGVSKELLIGLTDGTLEAVER